VFRKFSKKASAMKIGKRLQPIFVFILTLLVSACSNMPYERSMDNWGHMMNFRYGGFFMWLLFIVVVALVIYFIVIQAKKTGFTERSSEESALHILKKRYAKGEINKEEFDRMKKDIEVE
jgi:putative membrane protein